MESNDGDTKPMTRVERVTPMGYAPQDEERLCASEADQAHTLYVFVMTRRPKARARL